MAIRTFKKRNADQSEKRPKITVPQHESKEFFEARLERENIPDDFDLKTAVRGMGKVDKKLSKINKAVETLNNDRTLNSHGRAAAHVRYVNRMEEEVSESIYNVTRIVDKRTSELSEKINAPIHDEANNRDAREIRQWASQNFNDSLDVFKWVKQRIDQEDFESASALLGKKSYLSGLSEDNKSDLLDYYRNKRFAREMKIKEQLDKIGQAALHKIAIFDKYKNSITNKSTLKDIQAQKAREQAVKS